MRIYTPLVVALVAAAGISAASGQSKPFFAPVSITYTCPAQTGSLPTCTTSYRIPNGRLLVVQDVNGSALPIAPNAAGNFATDQASLLVTTKLPGDGEVINTIGPHYAINNSAVWNFHELTNFYSRDLPVVQNNGGPVVIEGYLVAY